MRISYLQSFPLSPAVFPVDLLSVYGEFGQLYTDTDLSIESVPPTSASIRVPCTERERGRHFASYKTQVAV